MTETPALAGLARTLETLQQLKRIRRTGWVDRGVPLPDVESVADHTLLTALVAWIVALDLPGLDAARVLKLAIIHDLAEAIVGDAPPYEPHEVPNRDDAEGLRAFFSVRHVRSPEGKAAKREAEGAAFAVLTAALPEAARIELGALWDEYEQQVSAEARFVKEVDTLEAYLQAVHYGRVHPDLPLQGFTDMAANEIDHEALTALRDAAMPDS